MKRRDLVRILEQHGCEFLREGGSHSVYINRVAGKVSTVPRHREINEELARKIFKDLEIPHPLQTPNRPLTAPNKGLQGTPCCP